jgi:hypothetical protein
MYKLSTVHIFDAENISPHRNIQQEQQALGQVPEILPFGGQEGISLFVLLSIISEVGEILPQMM